MDENFKLYDHKSDLINLVSTSKKGLDLVQSTLKLMVQKKGYSSKLLVFVCDHVKIKHSNRNFFSDFNWKNSAGLQNQKNLGKFLKIRIVLNDSKDTKDLDIFTKDSENLKELGKYQNIPNRYTKYLKTFHNIQKCLRDFFGNIL